MKLVNLNKKLNQADSLYNIKRINTQVSRPKKNFKKTLVRLTVLVIVLFLLVYLPVRGVYQSAKNISRSAKGIQAAAQNENLDDIKKNLVEMKTAADGLNSSLNWVFWLRFIPILGSYYADSKHFANALSSELAAAVTLTDSLQPYKSELGFTGQPTPGQDRIAQFVKILDKINPKLYDVEPQLKVAADEVKDINVEKYPETIGKTSLRSRIDTAKNFIVGAHIAVTQAKDALSIAPSALGEPNAKNYLIIFQNDKELRATGGFMTAYAFLKLDKGHMSTSSSDDIYRLDEKLLSVCRSKICPLSPPEPIVKYLPEANGKPRSAWSMRDSNLSPDLPTSIKQFETMYFYLGEGLPFDGVIMIDTHVVEELIKITGPVEVFGTKYSADQDPRCSCPNVIFELENYSQIIEKGEEDRKAILGTLMQQILAKSLSSSTQKLPEFINTAVKLANAKHIMLYMHDGGTQVALSKLNWTGEINKNFAGDFLHINDSNFAGGKSNLYVEEGVTLDINPSSTTHKLTIVYKNPQKYNIWLNGINRDYVRIYVPKGAKLTSSKGSEVEVTTKDDETLNKTYFEAFIQVRPQNSTTLSFEYTIPQTGSGKDYPILIQKQPGTKDFKYTVRVNGKTKDSFDLSADKEAKLSL